MRMNKACQIRRGDALEEVDLQQGTHPVALGHFLGLAAAQLTDLKGAGLVPGQHYIEQIVIHLEIADLGLGPGGDTPRHLVGDAVQRLRRAADELAYHLVVGVAQFQRAADQKKGRAVP